jgi:hypothetical protein
LILLILDPLPTDCYCSSLSNYTAITHQECRSERKLAFVVVVVMWHQPFLLSSSRYFALLYHCLLYILLSSFVYLVILHFVYQGYTGLGDPVFVLWSLLFISERMELVLLTFSFRLGEMSILCTTSQYVTFVRSFSNCHLPSNTLHFHLFLFFFPFLRTLILCLKLTLKA